MLNQDTLDNFFAIKNVISRLTGETRFADFEGIVSATVNSKEVIHREKIRVQLTYRTNDSIIDIHWEDFGYKNYKDMGLYGRMNTKWQTVREVDKRTLLISSNEGNNYSITIEY